MRLCKNEVNIRILLLFVLTTIIVGCSADVNVTKCEMNVKQGDTEIPCGTGYFNFGNIPLGFSQSITFTIENTGFDDLHLTGTPIIQVKGQNASDFTVATNLTASIVESGSETTFAINFKPTSLGTKTISVTIANDSANRNPYTFVLVGTGTQPAPEIHLKQGDTDILCSTSTFNFGTIDASFGSPKVEFTILNNGDQDLELTGQYEKINVSGTNAASFTIFQNNVLQTISSGNSTTFEISFMPETAGVKTAKISILNNDSDENPYTFNIVGTGITSPDINVKQSGYDMPNGTGKYVFDDTLVNESTEVTFTIENTGKIALYLSSYPDFLSITGADAAMFTEDVTLTDEYVLPGEFTTFAIIFSPTSSGVKSAIVEITSNDVDESPYSFTVEGKGVVSEINIKQGSTNILNNTGLYDFGYSRVGYSSQVREFTIENLGDGNLELKGNPLIVISGTNSTDFTVDTNSMLTSIQPGSSTTFKIEFTPANVGSKTATISIANNDLDENPYTFTITGIGRIYTKGDINGDGFTDVIIGAENDDDAGSRSGCAFIFFGGNSLSPKIDAANANVKLIGENSDDFFGNNVSIIGDVNNDGFDDVIVGAIGDDDGGTNAGCAYIFFGRSNWSATISATSCNVKIIGEKKTDLLGSIISFAGDINSDGLDDIIIGVSDDDDGGSDAGCAYIFFGRQNWQSTIDASNANVKIIGESSGDAFGSNVSNLGDVNKDGLDDIICGAKNNDRGGSGSGSSYIFFGRQNWQSTVNASTANAILTGEDNSDSFGCKVSNAGDINNDGINDVIVAAIFDESNGSRSGSVYLFFGRQSWDKYIDASNANVKIMGNNAEDRLGNISSTGDINNDGIGDFIIGSELASDGGPRSGCAYIFFGGTSWSSLIYASNCNVMLYGVTTSDYFGSDVSDTGDINKDGIPDIIIGAYGNDDGGDYAGCAYIFYGRSNWATSISASTANVQFIGGDPDDYFGRYVAGY